MSSTWGTVKAFAMLVISVGLMMSIKSGLNLLDELHDHNYTVPFHGVLMCNDFYCADLVNLDGSEISEEDRTRIHEEIRKEYSDHDS